MNNEFTPRTTAEDQGKREQLSTDQLDYMADLISELCGMARRADERTLAALLALAEAEASREAVRRRSNARR
ncbi:MAG: hypothetical protein SH859_15615 [Hyphomicrobium aestuarii]|nr:hypothetical protein [Hyphomicrobium aestuarii]